MNRIGRARAGAVLLAGALLCARGGACAQTASQAETPAIAAGAPTRGGAIGPKVEAVGEAIVVRDAAFEFGPASLRAPRVEIFGSTLQPGEVAASLAAGEADAVARLRRFDAKEVIAPEVSFTFFGPTGRQETLYRDVRMTDVSEGRIARFTAASAEVTTNADVRISGEMSGLTAERIDFGAALALFFGPLASAATKATLYERMAIDRYVVTTNGDRMEMRGLTGAGFRMAATERPLGEALRAITALTKDSDADALTASLAAARTIMTALEIDETRVDSVDFVSAQPNGARGRFDGLRLHELSGGRMSFALDAMRVESGDTATTLKGFALVGYDQLGALDAIGRFAGDAQALAEVNPAALIPGFRRVAIEEIAGCKPPREGCSVENADFALQGAALERAQVADGIDWRFAVSRLRLPASGETQATEGAVSSDVAWRPQARALSLREATLRLQGLGEARVSVDLENIMPQVFTEPRTAAALALTPAAARRVTLRLVDDGGVERLAARMAQNAGANGAPDKAATKARANARVKSKTGERGEASSAATGKDAPAPLAPREALAQEAERQIARLGDAPALKVLAGALGAFLRVSSPPLLLTVVAEPAIGAINVIGLKDYRPLLHRLTVTSERR